MSIIFNTKDINKNNLPVSLVPGNCSKCNMLPIPNGVFISFSCKVPIRFRFLWFNISYDTNAVLSYCPHCGHLELVIK